MALPHRAAALALVALFGPAEALRAAPQVDDLTEASLGDIVVEAQRLPGEVDTAARAIITLSEEDLAAYGAGSLAQLLAALAPQTGSGRGRGDGAPAVLLNGLRIASFREIRTLPPEAIRKVEVLPEDVALKYGFRPDSRVVNFILKDKFRSFGLEIEGKVPSAGGFSELNQEATLTRIEKTGRLNLTGTFDRRSALTEAERGIVQPVPAGRRLVPTDPVPGDFRTLLADTRSAVLNATWAKSLGPGASVTLNGLVQRNDNRGLTGLNAAVLDAPGGAAFLRTTLLPGPLANRTVSDTVSAGATLNAPLAGWQLAWTADGTRTATTTTIDALADLAGLQALVNAGALAADGSLPAAAIRAAARGVARSRSSTAATLATLTGIPLRLPGGAAGLTAKAGFAWAELIASDSRGAAPGTSLRRGDAQAGFSLDLPLTSRREQFGAALGDLSLNLNGEVHTLSDFGQLAAYGAVLTWTPLAKLTLSASVIASEKAPGLPDLGAPITVTSGVALFDFSRNETVLATVTTDGNPALLKERQRDLKISASWDMPIGQETALLVEYFHNRSSNTTNPFPLLTAEVEAAFPGRVQRDASGRPGGRIVAVDQRAVTFAEQSGRRIRASLNIGGAFGKADPDAKRGPLAGMRGGGGGSSGSRSGSRGRGPGDGRGHWNLSLAYTAELAATAQIAQGARVLDLLGGDALAGAGVARHSAVLEGGGFYRGFGLRISSNFASGTTVVQAGTAGPGKLTFGPLATLNVRAFVDLGRRPGLVAKAPFLKGSRILFGVTNLFDGQQKVTDTTGAVPLRYLPAYLDPAGRTLSLELRKQF